MYIQKEVLDIIQRLKEKGYKIYLLSNTNEFMYDKFIKEIDKDIIIMVDNCYCEFVETKPPLTIGADIIVGSLIKNLGGGIAPNGAYIAGRTDLVELAGERLTCPGEGREVGPTLGINKSIATSLLIPKPLQSGQYPIGALKENNLGSSSGILKSHIGQA